MDIIDILKNKKGFIAALDQSGGSSKKTLANYGVLESNITSDEVMFDFIHDMRSRVVSSNCFDDNRILGVILFKNTMLREVNDEHTAAYLKNKGIVSFLKIDNGLEEEEDGVQMLKDIPELGDLLNEAKSYGIVGTKMRSVIKEYNEYGIKRVVDQQFRIAKKIITAGLVPIIEPEVDINAQDKKRIESFLRSEISQQLHKMGKEDYVIFKFTLPEVNNYYDDLLHHKNVLRIVALSGGYSREVACNKLSENKKMIASFSRALLEGLNINQSDEEFDTVLNNTIEEIYTASVKKK